MGIEAQPHKETQTGNLVSFNTGMKLPLKSMTVGIDPVQRGEGDPSPDNIRPITGWTGMNIYHTDQNLIGGTVFRDAIKAYMPGATIDTENKIISYSAGANTVDTFVGRMIAPMHKIIKPNTAYTFILTYKKLSSSKSSNMRIYYSDGTYLDVPAVSEYSTKETKVVVTNSAKTPTSLSKRNGGSTTHVYYDECGVFEGVLTSADFTAYKEKQKLISWQTEAGTVYGGTLDVTTGVLTVTWANIASYDGETLPGRWISDRDVYASGTTPTTGAQVVYELAEPVEYTLSATEILTMNGLNNIWADTGNVTATYWKI